MRILAAKVLSVFLLGLFWIWLFCQWAQLDGERVFVWRPGETNAWLHSPLPSDRLSTVQTDGRGAFVAVVDEPLYFTVTPPAGEFDMISVDAVFLEGDAPLFEIGILKDFFSQAFDFIPLFHAGLVAAQGEEVLLADGSTALYVPQEDETMAAAVASEVSPTRVATYRATWPVLYREAARSRLNRYAVFSDYLYGSHEAFVYVQEGDVRFEATISDQNIVFGQDDLVLTLFNEEGVLVGSTSILDDGNVSDNGLISIERTVVLAVSDLPEGVYRLVFTTTSDVAFKHLEVTAGGFAFKHRVRVHLSSPTTMYTTAPQVVFEPLSADALGTVFYAGGSLELTQVGEKYVLDTAVDSFVLPGGIVQVRGEGTFGFSEPLLFSPQSPSLGTQSVHDISTAVLARLPELSLDDRGLRSASATWSLASVAKEREAYKFALSIPQASSFADPLRLYEIRVTLTDDMRGVDRFVFMAKQFIKTFLGL